MIRAIGTWRACIRPRIVLRLRLRLSLLPLWFGARLSVRTVIVALTIRAVAPVLIVVRLPVPIPIAVGAAIPVAILSVIPVRSAIPVAITVRDRKSVV